MRTVQPGATCNMQHAVALSCTASVIDIDAAAYDMSAAAAAFAAAASAASATALSKPYCTESSHKDARRNAKLATAPKRLQAARTEISVNRACARPCNQPTADSDVCCTDARRLPS
jgi:hypothetical protein